MLWEIDSLPASEFYEWMTYEQVEPFGDRRLDLNVGSIVATIANVNRKPETPAFKPTQCAFNWEPELKPQQTSADHLKIMTLFAQMHNAKLQANV